MTSTRVAAAVLFVALLAPQPLHARWESAADNKPVAALEQMSNDALFQEGFDVCVRRTVLEEAAAGEPNADVAAAIDYLNTIYPIVRAKNGGQVPGWMIQLSTAHTTMECQRGFRTFLESAKPPPDAATAPPTTAKPKQAKPKKARTPAKPRPPRVTNGLPPWLAPR